MTENKKLNKIEDDEIIEFTIDIPKDNTKLNNSVSLTNIKSGKFIAITANDLKIDNSLTPKFKTRSAMAKQMQAENNNLKDEYVFASLFKRTLAFILDIIFITLILLFLKFSNPVFKNLIEIFMNNYKLKFLLPDRIVSGSIMVISSFITLSLVIVFPLTFYNTSFGKKFLGLRIRGKDDYTISFIKAFCRELVWKPLSILIFAGFVMPFISKNRLSVHDFLAGTIVIHD